MRKITYAQAINETLTQLMESDNNVFLIGQGITSPWYVGSTTIGLLDRFGAKRVIDTPVSENVVTGVAVGAALAGKHPILMYPRMDFMYYALDQVANHAANWHYMFGEQFNIPLVIWAIINRGGGQAAQHAQALQAIFSHIPNLVVVMPSTPYDVRGLLVASVNEGKPVIFIDDRWLYQTTGDVPRDLYSVPLGKGITRRQGKDITLVATSYMVIETMRAATTLERVGIDAEIIEPRCLNPLDKHLILESIHKTGRLIVVDAAWKTCGVGAEISALVAEEAFPYLKSPIIRISLPNTPAPASSSLEKLYYPNAQTVVSAVMRLFGRC
jgi:pyruvate dehydrogenase E1 component beta subunit